MCVGGGGGCRGQANKFSLVALGRWRRGSYDHTCIRFSNFSEGE